MAFQEKMEIHFLAEVKKHTDCVFCSGEVQKSIKKAHLKQSIEFRSEFKTSSNIAKNRQVCMPVAGEFA